MVFRMFNSFSFLKTCGYQFQGSPHLYLFPSGGFQVKAVTWILLFPSPFDLEILQDDLIFRSSIIMLSNLSVNI